MTEPCRESLPAGENPKNHPPDLLRTIHDIADTPLLSKGWLQARVEKTASGCWLWRGPMKGYDYGAGPHGEYAHRWVYQHFVGPIPPGLHVLHRCDTPLCVNHAHLFLGSQRDNVRDAMWKRHLREEALKHGH